MLPSHRGTRFLGLLPRHSGTREFGGSAAFVISWVLFVLGALHEATFPVASPLLMFLR
jgi:hypothetical protein